MIARERAWAPECSGSFQHNPDGKIHRFPAASRFTPLALGAVRVPSAPASSGQVLSRPPFRRIRVFPRIWAAVRGVRLRGRPSTCRWVTPPPIPLR